MKRQVAVIGLGRFGYGVAETLVKKGCEVLAIDTDPEKIQAISDLATFAVQCDATDVKALKAISAQNVDVAVVSIGENIEASILIVQTLKEMGVKQIIAKGVTPQHGKILQNLGVTEVIFPERDAAVRLAQRLISPNVLEYLELSPGYSVEEVAVPDKMSGLRLREAQIREAYNVNIIGIRKKVTRMVKGQMTTEEVFNVTPSLDDDVIEKGDILIVVGKQEDLDRLTRLE
jgi:trk system potassium uptake protein TrkA